MCEDEIEIDDFQKYSEPLFPSVSKIEKHHINQLSYNDFFDGFMVKNKPLLIDGIADRWECMNWIHQIENSHSSIQLSTNQINFDYLAQKIRNEQNVPIANCNKVYFNSHEKFEMPFADFLLYWRNRIATVECDSNNLLYLKDWHLRRNQPKYNYYKTPHYFASDWLNEYCEEKHCDDYRFVYMGPKGTWTPFHADVFSSFSWSTNIVGTKRWIFFPPQEEDKLRDRLGNLPFDMNKEMYNSLQEKQIQFFDVIQRAGQTVFVPSGWHHQVWNLEDTISVNHNWFNGCNIHCIWAALYEKFRAVLHEIDDCKDMDNFNQHCQLMLKSDFGIDFAVFLEILQYIVNNRQKILQNNTDLVLNDCKLGRKHAIYDLRSILRVLKDFSSKCTLDDLRETSEHLLKQIDKLIAM